MTYFFNYVDWIGVIALVGMIGVFWFFIWVFLQWESMINEKYLNNKENNKQHGR